MTFQQMVETIFVGVTVITLMQFYRLSNTWIAERSIKAVKIIEVKSTGQMFRMTSSIFSGVQVEEIELADIEYKDNGNPDDTPLPAAYITNPLLDAKRNALLIIHLSKRAEDFDRLATKILGVSKIDGMGHETWKKAIQYMVDYHGIIKGQPGKSGKCGTDGLAPTTLDTLQHAIRVHRIPPTPEE